MPRYIDADELYKATEKRIKEANSNRMAVVDDEFLDLINDAFTEDVVPKSEVIDEFVKRLRDAPIKCAFPLFGLTTKTEIELYFNDIMLQFGDAIDSIAKEMKGGE